MSFKCIDARQEFDDILKLFSATDIKFTDEFIDEDGIYYVANILMNDDSDSKIKSLISDNAARFIDNGEYMFGTKYGYCDISDDGSQWTIECFVPIECCEQIDECVDDNIEIDESMIPVEESSNPKLGKKIKQLKGWKIYQGTDFEGNELFRCFTPDEYRPEIGYEDWECETLDQAISWIENYDLDENYIPIIEADDGDIAILPICEMSIVVNSDKFYIEIIDNKDYYDLYINEHLFIQEPKTESNRDWELKDFKLLAFDTFMDYYKETYFEIHD